ncbi:MAG TPA: lysophospholipid acyltransferase family protein [Miltoncostaeaceae bacterium]|nr:lysophospholipid acyltransferase family protein [Miltoncostaeaceae bacterium]
MSEAGINGPLWQVSRALAVPAFYGAMRLRREGNEHVPSAGATLIVSNHVSQKDPPLVGAAALPRRVHFMAKSELFELKPLGWYISRLGAFPVVRGGADREAIRAARDVLGRGDALIMFPEGTRTTSGLLRPPFPGAGSLALEPGVTVVPCAIWGSQRPLGPVRVVFGPSLDLTDLAAGARSERSREAARRMMTAIAGLVPAAGGPAQRPPEGEPSIARA